MRRRRVIANWKMNGDKTIVDHLLGALKNNCKNITSELIVCPPAVYLAQAQGLLVGTTIGLGAQNVNANRSGAYTGEISVSMLQEFGCGHVLVGHSERRSLFAETDQDVAEKFKAVVNAGLRPVLCVGESEHERNIGSTDEVVLRQLDAVVNTAGIESFSQAIVAYEPVWAIGTGNTATPEQAQEVHRLLRKHIELLSMEIAMQLPILYGGSVNPENAASLFAMSDIDGGLVGGASLDSQAFTAICNAAG